VAGTVYDERQKRWVEPSDGPAQAGGRRSLSMADTVYDERQKRWVEPSDGPAQAGGGRRLAPAEPGR
jgi:hypothetical protein